MIYYEIQANREAWGNADIRCFIQGQIDVDVLSYSKSNNPTFEEKRANYIVSNLFDNKYDLFHKYLTTHQPYIYNDILIKPETKKMYENIDSTIISSLKILEYEKYYNEVEKLYE